MQKYKSQEQLDIAELAVMMIGTSPWDSLPGIISPWQPLSLPLILSFSLSLIVYLMVAGAWLLAVSSACSAACAGTTPVLTKPGFIDRMCAKVALSLLNGKGTVAPAHSIS